MKKCVKIWLIAAAFLTVLGSVTFVGALAAADFDFSKISTVEFRTRTYEIDGDFESISINVGTADVILLPSEDGICKVVCREQKKVTHSAEIENGTLAVSFGDERKWYDHIGISFKSAKVTIYLPEKAYTSLSVKSTTGNVKIPGGFTFESVSVKGDTGNVSCYASVSKSVDLRTSTGNISLGSSETESITVTAKTGNIKIKNIKAGTFTAKVSTGNISLKNVTAELEMNIKSSTGNVSFTDCDGGEITVKTSTGNIKGSLLTEKIFVAKSSTGSIKVPDTSSGGICKLTASTGNIKITISGK